MYYSLGYITKTHGIKGELCLNISEAEADVSAVQWLLVDIDSLMVPFEIVGLRDRGSESYLVQLDGIDTDEQARILVGHTVFTEDADALFEDEYDDDDEAYVLANSLIGCTVKSRNPDVTLGQVERIDDSTDNVLMIVSTPGGQSIMIPIGLIYNDDIDADQHNISIDLPVGLISAQTDEFGDI